MIFFRPTGVLRSRKGKKIERDKATEVARVPLYDDSARCGLFQRQKGATLEHGNGFFQDGEIDP